MVADRILDISDEPARLTVKYKQLVIERDGVQVGSMPLAEIAAVAVSNPCVSFTQAVLAGLAEAGAPLVICDHRHLPVGMLLPIAGHGTQSERFARQASAPEPTRKRLWQSVVKSKIKAQGLLLRDVTGSDHGLLAMAKKVKSGDTENLEGQASRRYWPALFNDPQFLRSRDAEDQNRFLNYGYAILRATVARAICASGLHPSLGIHHHNRYDAFCLADDLMEPFRPLVDRAVVKWIAEHGKESEMCKEAKAAMLGALTERFDLEGEQRTLFDIAARLSSSLAQVFEGDRTKLALPDFSAIFGNGADDEDDDEPESEEIEI